MPHPLVLQLRFTRSEFKRSLVGVTDEEARQRFMPMNCISWCIGHLASQEQNIWIKWLQGKPGLFPKLNDLVGYGRPASTPLLDEMWAAWNTITTAADPFLDTLTTEMLQQTLYDDGKPTVYTPGSLLQRVIYHYWYHTGECAAIRQMLGHTDLPQFVGALDEQAPYLPH